MSIGSFWYGNCGESLLFSVENFFLHQCQTQSSWFMITTVSFAVSGLTTTWALNLKHFSQWQFLTVVFISGYYKAKSKTVSITAEGAIWSNITFLNLCFYNTSNLLAFVRWNNRTRNALKIHFLKGSDEKKSSHSLYNNNYSCVS